MKRIKVTIRNVDAGWEQERTAYQVSEFFAVHPHRPRSRKWQITHIPSGLRMGSPELNNRLFAEVRAKAIEERVEAVCPGFDWSGDSYQALKDLNRNHDFTKAMQEARRAVYGE